MTFPQKELETAEDFTNIMFWLAVQDYERRYATDTKYASLVKDCDEQIVLGNEYNRDQKLQGDRSSKIPLKTLRRRISYVSASYLPDRLEETRRDTGIVAPSSYHSQLDVHPTLANQNLKDFGPIGSCRKANPSKNISNNWAETAAGCTADLTALRNGSTPLCSLPPYAPFARESSISGEQTSRVLLNEKPKSSPETMICDRLSEPFFSDAFDQRHAHSSWSPYQESIPLPSCASQPRKILRVDAQDKSPKCPSNSMTLGPPTPRNFMPTNMVLERDSGNPDAKKLGSMIGYRGDLNSIVSRRQIPALADAYNCTLWLCNIPPSVQICEIFDAIDTGAVSCLHMMPPDHSHSTSAAKLAFMTPEAAAIFKRRADSNEGIWFHDNRLVSRYNRQGNLRDDTSQSRCVLIEGPQNIMNTGFWYEYFQKICVFQWDRVIELPCQKPARKIMQFNFVRISGQAQACMGAIRAQEEFSGVVQPAYAADPCGNRTARIMQQQGLRIF
ncbi:hypothetical protein B2J93_7553 [Marssonina coronariae]|uniref:RRM domain-containing protein n=1 Tax=Diplocarpon coronariae TaxID=2795749 RepID=A0A218Z8G4_9HELO|nr:hypothetical protein B2J93_7553 [Marssonina coronariae]